LYSSDDCHTLYSVLIFDASTLILLAKVDLLDIFLEDFEGTPVLPAAVEKECTAAPGRPDALLIKQRIAEGRLRVENVREPRVLERLVLDFRLGAGEAEALVLALAEEDPAIVATDDRNAIRACRVLRLSFVTSLGILVRAVEKGLLSRDDGWRCLDRLRTCGRFKNEVIEEVSRQIGDTSHGQSPENG
jgi:predicted nucleic acid-binding protein